MHRALKANVGRYETTGAGAAAAVEEKTKQDSRESTSLRRSRRVTRTWASGEQHRERLSFTPRHLPLTPATRGGFAVFIVFLASFTWITMLERNNSVFFFAEHTRQLIGVNTFRRLEEERHTVQEYKAWFTHHFIDGLANVSTHMNKKTASVVLVGPPRIRQIRYPANCSVSDEMLGLAPMCLRNSRGQESTEPFGMEPSTAQPYSHQSAAQTGDIGHNGKMHLFYSGGGYILPAHQYLVRELSVSSRGNELYPYFHWNANLTDLWASGWLDLHTKAIFHDFTLYSASLDLYANVRLTTEFEGNGGHMTTNVKLRTFWMQRDSAFMAIQWTFAVFLLLLILSELNELRHGFKAAEKVLVERCVELKYQLRLKKLQFGAEHGIPSLYHPQRVLKKLVYRLYQVDASCVNHMRILNQVGEQIPKLHSHYEDSMLMLKATGFSASKAFTPNAVVTAKLDRGQRELICLRDSNALCIRKYWIKTKAAVSCYYQDEWNALDSFNYSLLSISFVMRCYAWSLMPEQRDKVAAIPRAVGEHGTEPWRDEHWVNLFVVGEAAAWSFFLISISSILTWLKLFKFLSFFPAMSIFTKTVAMSAQHLGVFLVVVVIVMFGSASGFCLAFGTDIKGFSNPFISVISIALFTVGEFSQTNYMELVWSQRWLGPVLFWLYIFLVFFVLMSVFIAILSEGYEAAKSRIPATHSRDLWEAMQTVAVENYGGVKAETKQWFQLLMQPRLKKRVGVAITAVNAVSAFAKASPAFRGTIPTESIAVAKVAAKWLTSHRDANIETDSESDLENDVFEERSTQWADMLSMGREKRHAGSQSNPQEQGPRIARFETAEEEEEEEEHSVAATSAVQELAHDSAAAGKRSIVAHGESEALDALSKRVTKLTKSSATQQAALERIETVLSRLASQVTALGTGHARELRGVVDTVTQMQQAQNAQHVQKGWDRSPGRGRRAGRTDTRSSIVGDTDTRSSMVGDDVIYRWVARNAVSPERTTRDRRASP